METGAEVRQFLGHSDWVQGVAFSPDGRWVATGSNEETVRLWEADTAQEISRFEGHTWSVTSVAFSPEGRLLFYGSDDATIRAWEAAPSQAGLAAGFCQGSVATA